MRTLRKSTAVAAVEGVVEVAVEEAEEAEELASVAVQTHPRGRESMGPGLASSSVSCSRRWRAPRTLHTMTSRAHGRYPRKRVPWPSSSTTPRQTRTLHPASVASASRMVLLCSTRHYIVLGLGESNTFPGKMNLSDSCHQLHGARRLSSAEAAPDMPLQRVRKGCAAVGLGRCKGRPNRDRHARAAGPRADGRPCSSRLHRGSNQSRSPGSRPECLWAMGARDP